MLNPKVHTWQQRFRNPASLIPVEPGIEFFQTSRTPAFVGVATQLSTSRTFGGIFKAPCHTSGSVEVGTAGMQCRCHIPVKATRDLS